MKRVLFVAVLAGTVHQMAPAEESTRPSGDEAAIRSTADSFIKAWERGDAQAVAALWTENGSLADDEGRIYKGRKAIDEAYAALFKQHPGVKMEVAIRSIDFPTPAVAIEDGIATVVAGNATPASASRYTAVHVLQDGKWLMASVRESRVDVPSSFGRLQQLAWLVGQWEIKSDKAAVHSDIRWIANKSFLQRDYTVHKGGIAAAAGTQIIGWDPQTGQIKSWSFDSSGGHGTGAWTPSREGWRIASSGVMPDGTKTSSQDLLIRVGGENDVFGWRSFSRKVGTVELPDLPEIVLERVPEKP